MSATNEFLIDLADYVWLVEFAPLSFEGRGRARELFDEFMLSKFGQDLAHGFNEWYDRAYELCEEYGGSEWATGKHAQRLLSLVGEGN